MPTHRVLRSAAAKAARSSSRGPWTFSIPLGAVLAGLTVLAGCGAHAAPEVRGPDELVLLVGGDQPSLRAALVARGLQPAPPRVLTPLPVEPVGRGPVAGGVRGTDDEIQREPVGDEFHRPADQYADGHCRDLVTIDLEFEPEGAADVGRKDPNIVLVDPK